MRKIALTLALLGSLAAVGCGNTASTTQRQQSVGQIHAKLCYELLDQIKAKAHKLDNYGKDDLGSYGYNFILWQDLCTEEGSDTRIAPDDAN